MILAFFFVKKCFPYTDAANDDTSVVLYPCWILSSNLSSDFACVSKVYHIFQFLYCLVTVAFEITPVVLMTLLATISMRKYLWEVV